MEANKITFYKENISELIEGLTPFPENIFIEEQNWVNNYLLPLISIDLGILKEDLKGTVVHMLNPIEPYEGLIGEKTTKFHNEFCSENWIALALTEDNKYRFLGNEGYFLSAPQNDNNIDDNLIEYIKEIQKTYQIVKEKYKTKGKLLPWQDDNPQNFLDSLGGQIWYANWTETSPVPSAFEMNISDGEDLFNDGISITYKGREFIYIAEVAGYNYCKSGADAILMFYEPKSRIVLFSYDWT